MKATPTSGVRGDAGKRHNSTATLVKPDTLFTASGRGLKGSVTQWRWGIQGRIALDIESGEPIRQSWTLPVDDHEGGGLHALLALPHSSAILRFSEDFSRVDALSAADTYFDVSCRTLGVYQTAKRLTIQVTEKSIALIKGSERWVLYLAGSDAADIRPPDALTAFCAVSASRWTRSLATTALQRIASSLLTT